MGLLTVTGMKLISSGIGLASQVLARTSPKEFKKLNELKASKLKYQGLITDYKALRPSQRNQGKLENYIKELGKVEDGILVYTEIAETKLEIMLSQSNNGASSPN